MSETCEQQTERTQIFNFRLVNNIFFWGKGKNHTSYREWKVLYYNENMPKPQRHSNMLTVFLTCRVYMFRSDEAKDSRKLPNHVQIFQSEAWKN
jgi:hypothetical protein